MQNVLINNSSEYASFCPKVSIVIPVYNGGNYLKQAIDSAIAQTYENLEIIVVNDGSRDNGITAEIANSYGNKIRYFEKQNGGCASALNIGIKNMEGDYFSWLSHDDVYYPEKIEHQIKTLNTLEDKNTILYGGYEVIDQNSKSLCFVRPEEVIPQEKQNLSLYALLRGLIHGCALLIPKKYFDTVGFFDESLPSTQDYDLWFKIFRQAPLHIVDKTLIKSRTHPDQGTHKIPKHLDECNDLWCGFLKEISYDEMVQLEGSPYNFFKKTKEFLENTPYDRAKEYAAELAESAFSFIKVSVVIPFFNRIDWTLDAIHSVLDQTHSYFEVILVDDGSTEDISPILQVCQSDSRLNYVRGEHRGPAAARNLGVSHASGDYIAFLDSDDLFLPEKLAVQLEYMEKNQLSISHTSYIRMNNNAETIKQIDSGNFSGKIFPRIIASCSIAMPTVMAKACILRENPFPENFEIGEDVCLWISIASQYEFGGINIGLSKVRVSDTSAAFNFQKQAIGLSNILSFVINNNILSQNPVQIRSLIIDMASLYGTIVESQNNNSDINSLPNKDSKPSGIFLKLYKSVKNDGINVTRYKIKRKLLSLMDR